MDFNDALFITVVATFTLTAAISDLRTRRLPNWLTVPAFVVAVLVHTIVNGWGGLGFALGGFVVGFGALLVLWLIGGGGGGDVKLMGALGAWLGVGLILRVFFLSAALAALATAVLLVGNLFGRGFGYVRQHYLADHPRSHSRRSEASQHESHRIRQQRRRVMPYAIPVALATWCVLACYLHKLPW